MSDVRIVPDVAAGPWPLGHLFCCCPFVWFWWHRSIMISFGYKLKPCVVFFDLWSRSSIVGCSFTVLHFVASQRWNHFPQCACCVCFSWCEHGIANHFWKGVDVIVATPLRRPAAYTLVITRTLVFHILFWLTWLWQPFLVNLSLTVFSMGEKTSAQVACSAAITSCRAEWTKAMWIFQQTRNVSVDPDLVCYSVTWWNWAKTWDWLSERHG